MELRLFKRALRMFPATAETAIRVDPETLAIQVFHAGHKVGHINPETSEVASIVSSTFFHETYDAS